MDTALKSAGLDIGDVHGPTLSAIAAALGLPTDDLVDALTTSNTGTQTGCRYPVDGYWGVRSCGRSGRNTNLGLNLCWQHYRAVCGRFGPASVADPEVRSAIREVFAEGWHKEWPTVDTFDGMSDVERIAFHLGIGRERAAREAIVAMWGDES